MLALSREARQAIEQFQGRMSGELIVGGSSIPGEYILPALIGPSRRSSRHRDHAAHRRQPAVQEWVAEGRVEIGVVGAAHRRARSSPAS